MRRFFLILAIILTFKCFSYDEYLFYPQGTFTFTNYHLSGFSFENGIIYGVEKSQQKVHIGTIEKLNEWTRAYIFKVGDTVLSTHRAFLLSSGTVFDCLKVYEIYDERNQLIGFIEGVWDTNAAACFFFYNENHELFAKANLDFSYSNLTISTPDDQILISGKKIINASCFSSYYYPNEYYWKIKKESQQPFNAAFFWPFMGFLSEVWWS
ncbi:MAG: hypothetical protein NTX49_09970 [Chlamydiae bacterium]|nr:hypothetical protein [Chlamydiota bacterium]